MDNLQGILAGLNAEEQDFVLARSKTNSISAALADMGVSSSKFYERYDEARRVELGRLAEQVRLDRAVAGELELRKAMGAAVRRLVGLLDAGDERVQFQAAKLILERVAGKTAQPIDVSSGGMPIKILAGLPENLWDDGE